MASLNPEDLLEIEILDEKELPTEISQEIEAELCDKILHGEDEDDPDGAIDFIKEIVDKVKSEFKDLVKKENKKKFLDSITKIFTILLSVKADSAEKIIQILKLTVSTVLKAWSE